jgi:hypothetical protein
MMETPPTLPYAARVAKVQRLARSAMFRHDIKLAVRELCEALGELSGALADREQAATGVAPPTEESGSSTGSK